MVNVNDDLKYAGDDKKMTTCDQSLLYSFQDLHVLTPGRRVRSLTGVEIKVSQDENMDFL